MKATQLLKQQHREVEQLFEKIEKGGEPIQELLEELADNLAAHMVIEEQIFYPTVKRAADEQEAIDLVLESFEEHAIAKIALQRALATGIDEEPFKARILTLKELIENHVEEEEADLFPKVEKLLNDETLTALGLQMKELFDGSLTRGHGAILGQPAKIGGSQPPPPRPSRPRVANGAGRTADR